jgi:hypothetical protein
MSEEQIIQQEAIPEPIVEPVEVFELPAERFRREWAALGCDWSWQILKFLQGRRRNEVREEEVMQTETFARATDFEKKSLVFVAQQAARTFVTPEEDSRALNERDTFLMAAVDGHALGHRNWINELLAIPAAVREREEYDARMFPKNYKSPRLFTWIFGERPQ